MLTFNMYVHVVSTACIRFEKFYSVRDVRRGAELHGHGEEWDQVGGG